MDIFSSAFTKNDLFKADTVSLVKGEPIRVGERTVQAGEKISIGYGVQSGMDNAVGRIYADFKNSESTPGNVEGLVRLSVWSPQNRLMKILKEWRTEELRTSSTDRTKQIPLPEHEIEITEDKKLVLEIVADADATLSKANSTLVMSTTIETF